MSSRPSPYAGSAYTTTNYGQPILPQPRARVPQEPRTLEIPAPRPTLTAYQGYDGSGRRYFYKAADGWRDTLDETPWVPA